MEYDVWSITWEKGTEFIIALAEVKERMLSSAIRVITNALEEGNESAIKKSLPGM